MSDRKFMVIRSRDFGIFSNFLHTLQYLYSSEKDGRIPIVWWDIYWFKDVKFKNNSNNVWEYYFEPVSEYSIKDINYNIDNVIEVKKYRDSIENEPEGCWDYSRYDKDKSLNNPSVESRIFVHNIISKYVRLKQILTDKIEKFYINNIHGNNTIGVHLRGCSDAWGGEREIFIKKRIEFIENYINKNNVKKIFVATEYAPYLEAMIKKFGDIVCYYNCTRSYSGYNPATGCRKIKHRCSGGPTVGEESIIDCVLLSRCNFLLHGISNLSSCSLYFNPNVEHQFISHYE